MKDQDREIPIPPLSLDPEKYREHLKEMDLNTEQENELLQILWNIMSAMVDIGFGEHSVQTVMDSLVNIASSESEDTVEKIHHPINHNKESQYE